MRKIIVLTFVTLDGVMQSPGGPQEDPSGGFKYGGWTVPFFDDFLGEEMGVQMEKPFDLLLGRKTFEIFAAYWPHHPEEGASINRATKYVVSNTLTDHEWETSVFLGGDVRGLRPRRQRTRPGARQRHVLQALLGMTWWTNSGSKFFGH
jgi:dihydrofolate reductase